MLGMAQLFQYFEMFHQTLMVQRKYSWHQQRHILSISSFAYADFGDLTPLEFRMIMVGHGIALHLLRVHFSFMLLLLIHCLLCEDLPLSEILPRKLTVLITTRLCFWF